MFFQLHLPTPTKLRPPFVTSIHCLQVTKVRSGGTRSQHRTKAIERGTPRAHPSPGKGTVTGPRLAKQNSPEEKTHSRDAPTDPCSAGESQRPARPPSVNRGTASSSQGRRVVPTGSCSTWTFAPGERAARQLASRMRRAQGSQSSAPGSVLLPASQQASVAHLFPNVEPHIYYSISLFIRNLFCFTMISFVRALVPRLRGF